MVTKVKITKIAGSARSEKSKRAENKKGIKQKSVAKGKPRIISGNVKSSIQHRVKSGKQPKSQVPSRRKSALNKKSSKIVSLPITEDAPTTQLISKMVPKVRAPPLNHKITNMIPLKPKSAAKNLLSEQRQKFTIANKPVKKRDQAELVSETKPRQTKKNKPPASAAKVKSAPKKVEPGTLIAVKTKTGKAKAQYILDLPVKNSDKLRRETSKIRSINNKPGLIKDRPMKNVPAMAPKSAGQPLTAVSHSDKKAGLESKQLKLNLPVEDSTERAKKQIKLKSPVKNESGIVKKTGKLIPPVKTSVEPLKNRSELHREVEINPVKIQPKAEVVREKKLEVGATPPKPELSAENRAGPSRKQPDRWSDCGQVFFTGGEAFGLGVSLRTIYIGRESDVKTFLNGGNVDESLKPFQKDILLKIREFQKSEASIPVSNLPENNSHLSKKPRVNRLSNLRKRLARG